MFIGPFNYLTRNQDISSFRTPIFNSLNKKSKELFSKLKDNPELFDSYLEKNGKNGLHWFMTACVEVNPEIYLKFDPKYREHPGVVRSYLLNSHQYLPELIESVQKSITLLFTSLLTLAEVSRRTLLDKNQAHDYYNQFLDLLDEKVKTEFSTEDDFLLEIAKVDPFILYQRRIYSFALNQDVFNVLFDSFPERTLELFSDLMPDQLPGLMRSQNSAKASIKGDNSNNRSSNISMDGPNVTDEETLSSTYLNSVQDEVIDLDLRTADYSVKCNKLMVEQAVLKSGENFKYAANQLKDDEEFVLKLLEYSGNVYKYASPRLKLNSQVVLLALRQEPELFKQVPFEFRDDDAIALDVVSRVNALYRYVSDRLKSYEELLLIAVKNYPENLFYTSDDLRLNPIVCRKAIEVNSRALDFCPSYITFCSTEVIN